MRIAVMGAGAVGSYYGGMLARAGHAVTLITRPQHVEQIQSRGLLLETGSAPEHVALSAATDASGARGAELVLFCVKSTDTGRAGAELAGHLESDASVLCLQNGVDNATRLEPVVRRRVEAAVVYAASEMAGPGHVRYRGGGELVLGRSSLGESIAALFEGAGLPVRLTDDISAALWAKLIVNCAYNALSAITQLPYGKMVQAEGVESVMQAAVAECMAVAKAAQVDVAQDIWTRVRAVASGAPAQYSSTAQDVRLGKLTEIDFLNGFVVRKGRELGLETPVNHVLHTLVKALESRTPH